MEILSLIISALGVVVTIVLYYSVIDKKLGLLIERESGTLTYNQAKDLAEIYLEHIQFELHVRVQEFVDSNIDEIKASNNLASVDRFVNKTIAEVIDKTRNKTTRFKLRGGQNFKEFIETVNPIQAGIIKDTRADSFQEFVKAIEHGLSADRLKNIIFNKMEEAGRMAAVKVRAELEKRYR